jgi:lipase
VRSPELRSVPAGVVRLAVWDWPGREPPLLLAHATGFHGRCWDEVVRLFPDRRCLAVEFRGHGRSSKPDPPYSWRSFGDDVAAVSGHLGLSGAIGIGHSMGGHALVSSVARRPQTFAALLLIDPVIHPPEIYGLPPFQAPFILRRRARWSGPAEMLERFRGKPPFESWDQQVLRDYCEFGLLPDGDGYVLACPPAVEASIYAGSNAPEANLYAEIPQIAQPVTVLRAGSEPAPGVFDLSASPTWPRLASRFPRGRDVLLRERNHYIPMECPEVVAEAIGGLAAGIWPD